MSRGHLGDESDERLVALAGQGSEVAFGAIVGRYRLPLTRYCARLAPDGQAEDTVQETFVKAFRALERGEQVLTLGAWLHRIAHNTALNSVRAHGLHDQPLDELAEAADTTSAAVERRLGLRDMVTAVQALPVRQRSVIVQRELEGRSYEEIAGRLGVSSGAVRQLLNRARTSLRAGAAVLVAPLAPLSRLASGLSDAPGVGRVAELCGSGGSGVAAKLCATAVLTGAIAGGIQPAAKLAPEGRRGEADAGAATRPRAARASGAPAAAPVSPTAPSNSRDLPRQNVPGPGTRPVSAPGGHPRHGSRPQPGGRSEGPSRGQQRNPGDPRQRLRERAGEGGAEPRQRRAPDETRYAIRPPENRMNLHQSASIAPRQPLPTTSGDGYPPAGRQTAGQFLP